MLGLIAILMPEFSHDLIFGGCGFSVSDFQGVYGDNGSLMYHHGYGYAPYSPYPPAGSPVPTVGHDGQLYGPQHYQYPTPYFQPPTPTSGPYSPSPVAPPPGEVTTAVAADQKPLSVETANGNPNGLASGGPIKGNNGSAPMKPTYQSTPFSSNGSYGRGALPGGVPASGYQDPRFGFDGLRSPLPWLDGPVFSDPRPVTSTSITSTISNANNGPASRNLRPHSHFMVYRISLFPLIIITFIFPEHCR